MMTTLAWIFALMLTAMTLAYMVVIAGFSYGLKKLRRNEPKEPDIWPSVSVIVPARNEAVVLERTVRSLLEQDYTGLWEIVVVDDRSHDNTPEILGKLAEENSHLRFIRITEPHPRSPKKNALAAGIRSSTSDIIITTDADCTYHTGWIRNLVSHMSEDVGIVAGLTVFSLSGVPIPFWQKVQWLDFLVQQFLAAGAVGYGIPSSCNGSNLAYRRKVYSEISGFGDGAKQVSGDDVLFAQRVSKLTSWKTAFATTPDSIVESLPVLTLREMVHQRLRWASKGLAYRRSMLAFLFGIYAYYAMWISAPLACLLIPGLIPWVVLIAGLKLIWDYRIVRLGCTLFGQYTLLPYFLPYVFLHTLTTPFFGIGGLFVAYRWKGEWYRTARLPRSIRRGLVRVRRISRHRRAVEPAS